MIQELLWLGFRFAAALTCSVSFRQSLAALSACALGRNPAQTQYPSVGCELSSGHFSWRFGRVSAAAELGLARPTLFLWFRYRRETCRTDKAQFSTTVYFLYYMKQSLVVARPVAVGL